MKKVLITGACGGLAQIVAQSLAAKRQEGIYPEIELIGVDPRKDNPGLTGDGDGSSLREKFDRFHRINYTHRKMEELFAAENFDTVVHLGRVRVTSGVQKAVRYTLNVLGTRNILQLCMQFKVKQVVVISTYHVYGALETNHLHITEDEPLKATQMFPELADAVDLDHYTKTFTLQYPEIHTILLRPVNIVGPNLNNAITRLLKNHYVPSLMGYDPMMQFIHEKDFARAVETSMAAKKSGVYNVAGEGMLPYSHAIAHAGAKSILIPHFMAYPLVRTVFRSDKFPMHLMDYFRYPTIVSDAAFREDFGYNPSFSTVDTLRSVLS